MPPAACCVLRAANMNSDHHQQSRAARRRSASLHGGHCVCWQLAFASACTSPSSWPALLAPLLDFALLFLPAPLLTFSRCVCCLQVSRVARMMISQMGFSKKLGQVAWSGASGNSFMGSQMAQPSDCSADTQDAIDAEVKVGVGWAGAGAGAAFVLLCSSFRLLLGCVLACCVWSACLASVCCADDVPLLFR